MVTQAMLRTDLPKDIRDVDGGANVILALCADCYYAPNGSNSYLPNWQTMTACWYLKHTELYRGWIELEDVPLPPFAASEVPRRRSAEMG